MGQRLAMQVHTRQVLSDIQPIQLGRALCNCTHALRVQYTFKYVCTMIHRKFFPILGYLGQRTPLVYEEIMCHPKLLYIEKQSCALTFATPNVSEHIAHKEASIMSFPKAARKVPLAWLSGLKDLLEFYNPAAFLLGNLARDCNWDGRPAGAGCRAQKVLELSFLLIVALTINTEWNVPYVRTMCVALLLWLPCNDAVRGCCCAEEALEGIFGRLGPRYRVYPQMKTFDQTFLVLEHANAKAWTRQDKTRHGGRAAAGWSPLSELGCALFCCLSR